MPSDLSAFVLEVARQENLLTMSIFERNELASTIKHYSRISVSIPQINNLCQEVTAALNNAVKRFRSDNDQLGQLKKTGQLLWDHLLTPEVKSRLSGLANKELVLSLDEELISIPWELLYDGDNFFCLKFSLGRVILTKENLPPVEYRGANSVLKMLILANPTNDLKSAYLEGVHIRNQFDRLRKQVKIDFKSTQIDTLYVKKSLRDYDIVHFAGHCEYDIQDPKSAGWLLSDGRFTTKDILALSKSLTLPSLVFSNACHSAQTAGNLMNPDYQEKTYSLAAAFLFSGVRHYIGTIWQIGDPVSLLFAKEFYWGLIRGKPIGESIRLGRLKLIKEFGSRDIFWASYILYGDPHFKLFRPPKHAQPSKKIRENIKLYRKRIIKFAFFGLIIFSLFYFYVNSPLKNPGSYFLFLESNSLFKKGRNSEAIISAKKIIKDDPAFLFSYPLIASAYERLGERDNSLKYYFDYAFHSQKKKDFKSLASAYTQIGWVYQLLGEFDKAVDFYDKAIILSKENKDKLNEAVALRKLAVWHIEKEDYDKALELLMKSLEINRERQYIYSHRYNLACDYFDIGLVFSDKDDIPAAREFYKKSQVLFEKMKLKSELSDYYFNLGELCLFEKQYNEALEYYFKGLNIDLMHGNKPAVASGYSMIGELFMEMGNFGEAEKFFLKSISACLEIKVLPELAAAYQGLGALYKQKKDKIKAKEFLMKAQEIYRNINTPSYKNINQEIADLNS